MSRPRIRNFRNKLAHFLVNLVMMTIATPEYRHQQRQISMLGIIQLRKLYREAVAARSAIVN